MAIIVNNLSYRPFEIVYLIDLSQQFSSEFCKLKRDGSTGSLSTQKGINKLFNKSSKRSSSENRPRPVRVTEQQQQKKLKEGFSNMWHVDQGVKLNFSNRKKKEWHFSGFQLELFGDHAISG